MSYSYPHETHLHLSPLEKHAALCKYKADTAESRLRVCINRMPFSETSRICSDVFEVLWENTDSTSVLAQDTACVEMQWGPATNPARSAWPLLLISRSETLLGETCIQHVELFPSSPANSVDDETNTFELLNMVCISTSGLHLCAGNKVSYKFSHKQKLPLLPTFFALRYDSSLLKKGYNDNPLFFTPQVFYQPHPSYAIWISC